MTAPARLRLVAIILTAGHLWSGCSPGGAQPPTPGALRITAPVAEATSPPTPEAIGGGPGCYYLWATRELPELGDTLQRQVVALDPRIQASAYAFGEECRKEDGTVAFLAMETDFRLRLPVQDLGDETALGNELARAMALIEELPTEGIPGPRPGRVEFEFYTQDSESLRLTIEISRYRAESPGLEGAVLLRHFRPSP